MLGDILKHQDEAVRRILPVSLMQFPADVYGILGLVQKGKEEEFQGYVKILFYILNDPESTVGLQG